MDTLSLEPTLERLAVEAVPLADRASHPHVCKEVHFQAVGAVALARLAAAAGFVKAEPSRFVAANLGLGQLSEQSADFVEDLDVCRRIRAWRPTNGRLIYVDDLV